VCVEPFSRHFRSERRCVRKSNQIIRPVKRPVHRPARPPCVRRFPVTVRPFAGVKPGTKSLMGRLGKSRTNPFTSSRRGRYALITPNSRSPMLSPLTSLFRGWRAALLLVVIACATPGRAAAECGDYVTVLNDQATNVRHAMPAPVGAPASPKAPCSGPNCSRLPDRHAPLPAPAPVSVPHGKELAHVLGLLDPPDLAASSRTSAYISSRPISRATSIFHPPRAG
jgi:hypothetical protein